ncbi:MAG: hypothetical protein LC793_07480 [Thermomicrobia bacterium]|nr:hypothetical protein [Thermomicrobia bacterium]
MGSLAQKGMRRGVSFTFFLLVLPFLCSIVTVRAAPLALDPVFQPFASAIAPDILGLPISPVVVRDGMRYQYTERARLETPATGNGPVQLARIGAILSSGRDFRQLESSSVNADTRYFPETRHSLAYGFRAYWEQRGGVDLFGLPISEEFPERNPADGRMYDVQYFERAKFERHPEFANTPNEIQLGFLGKLLYQFAEGVRLPGATDPVAGLTTLGNPALGVVTEFTNQPRERLLRLVSDLGMR